MGKDSIGKTVPMIDNGFENKAADLPLRVLFVIFAMIPYKIPI